MTDNDIEWISTSRAAEMIGVTARTLYRFIDAGQIPGYRFGRVIRIDAADVGRFIAAAQIAPGSLKTGEDR